MNVEEIKFRLNLKYSKTPPYDHSDSTTNPLLRPYFFGTDFFLHYLMVVNSDTTTTPILRITTSYPDQNAQFVLIFTPFLRSQLFCFDQFFKFCNILLLLKCNKVSRCARNVRSVNQVML